MMKQGIFKDYESPMLTTIECSVEAGFAASNIGEDEGYTIPNFSDENDL